MPTPSLTLQCRQCSGVFATPKVDFSSLVQCPHCATAAPVTEFEALKETTGEEPEIGQSISADDAMEQAPAATTPTPPEGDFQVRGKWLQFDCPHCIRPMRLVAEDAGGLVDCAHCGLELIAPDPAIGRGARLSRASEVQVKSISRHDLTGGGPREVPQQVEEDPNPFAYADEDAGEDLEVAEPVDPNHSLARASSSKPKRAIKALDTNKIGRSFRRKDVVAEQAMAASDKEWQPTEERSAFGESWLDRYGFWIALGGAALVMAGIVFLVIREASQPSDREPTAEKAKFNAAQKAKAEEQANFEKSYDFAKQALASESWEALVPLVRNPEKVGPRMRSYYTEEKYEPIILTGFHAPRKVDTHGLEMHEFKATDAAGNNRILVVEQSADGRRLDWELMVGLARHNWIKFIESRPQTPKTVRAIAMRASVQESYFTDAGLTRDNAIGIRLQQGQDDVFWAVVPKDSPLGKTLSTALEWDRGRKVTIKASFDPESKINDRIRLEELVQTGWDPK